MGMIWLPFDFRGFGSVYASIATCSVLVILILAVYLDVLFQKYFPRYEDHRSLKKELCDLQVVHPKTDVDDSMAEVIELSLYRKDETTQIMNGRKS